jgi:SAM-dependent methyltransferase
MNRSIKKINIGCGPTGQIKGFDNLDNSPSVLVSKIPFLKTILYKVGIIAKHQYDADWSGVIRCDASKGLPYKDESVDKIYSSHFLEHIPQDKALSVLKECYRVLKPEGVMRLVVPDLFFCAKQYVEKTKVLLEQQKLSDDRHIHDAFLNDMYGAYLNKKRYGAEHCYMYDTPTLVAILNSIGFQNIQLCQFQEGNIDEELAFYDSRPQASIHLEALR